MLLCAELLVEHLRIVLHCARTRHAKLGLERGARVGERMPYVVAPVRLVGPLAIDNLMLKLDLGQTFNVLTKLVVLRQFVNILKIHPLLHHLRQLHLPQIYTVLRGRRHLGRRRLNAPTHISLERSVHGRLARLVHDD